jgi:hypothetical protein
MQSAPRGAPERRQARLRAQGRGEVAQRLTGSRVMPRGIQIAQS